MADEDESEEATEECPDCKGSGVSCPGVSCTRCDGFGYLEK